MANRRVVRRLSDLVPDILIDAQRCDEITTRKALERAVEDLAYNHGFFRTTLTFSILDTTTVERVNDVDYYVFFSDDTEILTVDHVEAILPNGAQSIGGFEMRMEGKIYVAKWAVPSNATALRFYCTMLPMLDEDVTESSAMTRGRRVIVALALYDVYSKPGKQWSSPDAAAYWMRTFQEAMASWNYHERFAHNTAGVILATNPFA